MSTTQLEFAIRLGAAGILCLLAWLMFSQRRLRYTPTLLFVPLAFCVSGFVLGNTPLPDFQLTGVAAKIANTASGMTVIFLWWFSLSCFDSGFRLRGPVLIAGLAWAALAAGDRGFFGKALANVGLSHILVAFGFGIVVHLIWRLLEERRGDLIRQRHEARVLVAVLLGGMLLIDLAADAVFGFGWRPLGFAMVQNSMILAFGIWLAGRLLAIRPDVLTFGVTDKVDLSGPPPLPTDPLLGDPLYQSLLNLIEKDRVHLDPELTFERFVKLMAAPERAVRALINQQLGYDHFRAFLNYHRVKEACRLLGERSCDSKLIAIAFDSGFASLASFNRAFRAVKGCTPSAYRADIWAPDTSHPSSEERLSAF